LKLLILEEWVVDFNPLMNEEDQEIFYETHGESYKKFQNKIEEISKKNGTEPYQHVWTRVDGESGRLILLNGYHLVNRIDFCVTEKPWGTGDLKTDAKKYIEVTYEDMNDWNDDDMP